MVWIDSLVFIISKVMGDTSEYLVYAINVKRRNDKSRRSYASFGDVCFEMEFIEACSSKLVISLSRFIILTTEVEDIKNTCW